MSDEQIVKELGLEAAPEAVKEQSLNQVKYIVAARVGGILEAVMDEDQQKTFEILKKESADATWKWLDETFVDTNKLRAEVLQDYIKEFNSDLDQIKN